MKPVQLPDELHAKFKATCAARGVKMGEVVELLISEWMSAKPSGSPVKVQSEVQPKPSQSTVESAGKLPWMVEDKAPHMVADDEEREKNSFLHGDTKQSNSNDPNVWLKELFGE